MPSLSLPVALVCLVSGAPLAQGQSARSWVQPSATSTAEGTQTAGTDARSGDVIRPAAYQGSPNDHREMGAPSSRKPGARPSADAGGESPRSSGPLVTTMASLAVVVGLFFLVMWLVRRHLPRGMGPLPSDVLEVLGRAAVGQKQSVTLLRLGDRLLLVAISAAGIETLSEITDPDEVTRLLGLCRQAQPQSATTAFREVLQQMSSPPRAAKAEDRHA
jgi:flagellar biogenesis protein FliO